MKSLIAPLGGASLAVLLAVGVAAAASPAAAAPPAPVTTSAPARPVGGPSTAILPSILGLSNTEIQALRQQGLSLAQIAERQKVDPQKLVDALVTQWSSRIDARVAAGAITADQAKTLKADLATRAKAMVEQTALGGMRGAAVGAGPNGTMRAGAGMGAGGRGMMRGSGNAPADCPAADTVPGA